MSDRDKRQLTDKRKKRVERIKKFILFSQSVRDLFGGKERRKTGNYKAERGRRAAIRIMEKRSRKMGKKYFRSKRYARGHAFAGGILAAICGVLISVAMIGVIQYQREEENQRARQQRQELAQAKQESAAGSSAEGKDGAAGKDGAVNGSSETSPPEMLAEYRTLYEWNNDLIGWLSIEDTLIDYPVMQTPWNEEYYLQRDFYGEDSKSGSLFVDTDCTVGVGTRRQGYLYLDESGEMQYTPPTTNLMIYGNTMRSGEMFGKLQKYEEIEYAAKHHRICFDSLYEHREYELMSVFYAQTDESDTALFRYDQFFQADTLEKFNWWYINVKRLSLYDTGMEAEFGDEFITLNCNAYRAKNERFVVIGKRVK